MAWTSYFFITRVFPFLIFFISANPNSTFFVSASKHDFSIIDSDLLTYDYSPPSPPPPPPHPPSDSCEQDLKGIGSFNTTCRIGADVNLTKDVYVEGSGSIAILPGVTVSCSVAGCSITFNISGDFSLGQNASIVTGAFVLCAQNASFLDGSVVNTTALAGDPPPQTTGAPQDTAGAGGGHGGRGASCLTDKSKSQDDVWGGDTYSWSALEIPVSYGSKGGTTTKEEAYGGGGGGRVWMKVVDFVGINGTVLAEGGNGGLKGGGGSGGSIYIKAHVS